MKVKKLIELKEQCDRMLKHMEMAKHIIDSETNKVALTKDELLDITEVLNRASSVVNMILDNVEVDIG